METLGFSPRVPVTLRPLKTESLSLTSLPSAQPAAVKQAAAAKTAAATLTKLFFLVDMLSTLAT